MLRTFLLLLTLTSQDPTIPLPDFRSFMAEVRMKLRTDTRVLSEYTYTERKTSIQVDSNGRPKKSEVDVFEVFPGSAERVEYRRQIVRKGVPVSAQDLGKQDRDNEKRNQRSPEQRRKAMAEEEREEQDFIDDVFGVYETSFVGRENIGGRPAIAVAFRPQSPLTYKTKSSDGKHLRHFMGRVWFDENDHEAVRLEIEAMEPVKIGFGLLARLQKGARITSERRKFNDEVWLPVRAEVSIDLRLLLLKGLRIRQVLEYTDHQKYSVDTILKFPDDVN
jgi:hypothetical protein